MLSPADADMLWQSETTPNDQFLLYCFAAEGLSVGLAAAAEQLKARAAAIADLGLRVCPVPGGLDYPRWTPAPVDDDQFRIHPGARDWQECLDAVCAEMNSQLDAQVHTWRVHLYGPVGGVPGAAGDALVAVFQVSHALGDGRRASTLARELFGGDAAGAGGQRRNVAPRRLAPVAGALKLMPQIGAAAGLGLVAARRSARCTDPAGRSPMPATSLNTAPGPERVLRTLTVDAGRLCFGGQSVTAGAIVVIGRALSAYLGDDVGAVELTIGREPDPIARNNFFTASIGTHLHDVDRSVGAAAVAADIAAARRRDGSAGRIAARRAARRTPAVLERLGVRLSANAPQPVLMSGATVVSSVNRGAGDLRLTGLPVLFTAGFPALSRVHSLTHGVHGIGGAVTISVHASTSAMPDVDRYAALLKECMRSGRAPAYRPEA
ncbi:MAG: DUF1298 domain-containing protein [Gordonia sp. (in: high G+C Gram-positive bacteria)]